MEKDLQYRGRIKCKNEEKTKKQKNFQNCVDKKDHLWYNTTCAGESGADANARCWCSSVGRAADL